MGKGVIVGKKSRKRNLITCHPCKHICREHTMESNMHACVIVDGQLHLTTQCTSGSCMSDITIMFLTIKLNFHSLFLITDVSIFVFLHFQILFNTCCQTRQFVIYSVYCIPHLFDTFKPTALLLMALTLPNFVYLNKSTI